MRQSTKTWMVLYLLTFALSLAWPAHAYLDPGSGSMILQFMLGGVAGIFVLGRVFWQNLLMFFGLRKAQKDSETP